MGAYTFSHVTEYNSDFQKALEQLQQKVFEEGDYEGADLEAKSIDELFKIMIEDGWDTGTDSILDYGPISDDPQQGVCPLTEDELISFFNTSKPTLKMIEQNDSFWQSLERATARLIVIYEKDIPKNLYFACMTFD